MRVESRQCAHSCAKLTFFMVAASGCGSNGEKSGSRGRQAKQPCPRQRGVEAAPSSVLYGVDYGVPQTPAGAGCLREGSTVAATALLMLHSDWLTL